MGDTLRSQVTDVTTATASTDTLDTEFVQSLTGFVQKYFPARLQDDFVQICTNPSDSRHTLFVSAASVPDDPLHSRDLLVLTSKNLDVLALALVYKLFVLQNHPTSDLAAVAISVYAPLASRLGLPVLKTDIADAAFRVLRPDDYSKVAGRINMLGKDVLLSRAGSVLEAVSDFPQIVSCSSRVKSVSSVLNKLFSVVCDDVSKVDDLHDLVGVRFIVSDVDACYALLAVFSDLFTIDRFKDYIAKPKPNGYRSLHFVVNTPDPVEVQIRTVADHAAATEGVFSHHLYKYGNSPDPSWFKEALSSSSISEALADKIFVYTPAGKAVVLPAGATVLDFAYSVHTQVGHCARGAFVDGKFCSLDTVLYSEQQVQIVKASAPHPSQDWLNFLVTSAARAKVRKWLRDQAAAQNPPVLPDKTSEELVSSHGPALQKHFKKPAENKTLFKLAAVAGSVKLAGCCKPTYPSPVRARVVRGEVVVHSSSCPRLLPSRQVDVWWIPQDATIKTVTLPNHLLPAVDTDKILAVYSYDLSTTYVYFKVK